MIFPKFLDNEAEELTQRQSKLSHATLFDSSSVFHDTAFYDAMMVYAFHKPVALKENFSKGCTPLILQKFQVKRLRGVTKVLFSVKAAVKIQLKQHSFYVIYLSSAIILKLGNEFSLVKYFMYSCRDREKDPHEVYYLSQGIYIDKIFRRQTLSS